MTTLYVCDRCGTLEERPAAVPEGGDWNCASCGSCVAWEFPAANHVHALEHSLRIQRIAAGGLFA